MRVFLTGASGYLGGVLAEHLAQMPEVTAITGVGRTIPSNPLPSKLKFLQMDICSPDLTCAMAGHEVIVHAACVVLWSAKMSITRRDDINLNGARNVARAALHSKARRFVHASSMAAYDPRLARGRSGVGEDFPLGKGDSPFYYWNSKAVAERTLKEILGPSTTMLTIFRPIYIIGPRNSSTIRRYRENAVNLLGHDARRQFIQEEDVAAAFIQALRIEMPGPFNIVPDDFIRMSDVWRTVGGASGHMDTVAVFGIANSSLLGAGRFGGFDRHKCEAPGHGLETTLRQRGRPGHGTLRSKDGVGFGCLVRGLTLHSRNGESANGAWLHSLGTRGPSALQYLAAKAF
jgi:nucleoside-diphosphate-sugar epimerase